ncbi:MAG: UDP-2,3-diacylglucosamine diphosphatase [Saprospiraceae bacterium]
MIKAYFASDFHLGIDSQLCSRDREDLICNWIDMIAKDATHVFLLGDLFDFWFEYKHAIPKGYVRLIGRLASLKDSGIDVHIFTGNHDLWMENYFTVELGIPIHYHNIEFQLANKNFLLGHGDGLGPGDYSYKRMKKIFTHPFSKFLYRWLHPDLGIPLANYFSGKSRKAQKVLKNYLGHEKEWLIQYVELKAQKKDYDFYIFGHRHLPIDYTLKNNLARYINLGDWLIHQSYAQFDGESMKLCFYKNENGKIYH